MEYRRGSARPQRRQRNGNKEGRTPVWSVSSKTLGFYLVVFWALCVAGSGMVIRRQALAHDGDFIDTALGTLVGVGAVGLGAAVASLILSLAVEAIMVLAQMLKRRQYEQGYEEGVEEGVEIGVERGVEIGREEGVEIGVVQGREEGVELGVERGRKEGVEIGVERGVAQGREEGVQQARRQHSAKLRAWAEERGIPADDLPELGEPSER